MPETQTSVRPMLSVDCSMKNRKKLKEDGSLIQ